MQALDGVVGGLGVDEELDALAHRLPQFIWSLIGISAVVEIMDRDSAVGVLLQIEIGSVLVAWVDGAP